MELRESNYEITKHRVQAEFASYDMDAICREWNLEQVGGRMLLTILGRRYLVDRESGAVLWDSDGSLQEADFNVSMTVYDILTRPHQTASGEMVSIKSLSTLQSANIPGGSMFDRLAKRFDHRCEHVAAVCERLGGTPYGRGDVSYLLPAFRDVNVAVSFWESDEEFPPKLNFLCDGNILHFMHYETMMYLLCHVAERMEEEFSVDPAGL